jgi:hypothetical protein
MCCRQAVRRRWWRWNIVPTGTTNLLPNGASNVQAGINRLISSISPSFLVRLPSVPPEHYPPQHGSRALGEHCQGVGLSNHDVPRHGQEVQGKTKREEGGRKGGRQEGGKEEGSIDWTRLFRRDSQIVACRFERTCLSASSVRTLFFPVSFNGPHLVHLLQESDLLHLKGGGTGFSASGDVEAKKHRVTHF